MKHIAPSGTMYQAGTLSGNPLAMTAGIATIRTLLEPGAFDSAAQATATLVQGIDDAAQKAGIPIQSGAVGSMFGFYFLIQTGAAITNYASAKQYADTERYGQFFHAMLERGVYFAPSQFEAGFTSTAHTNKSIEETLRAVQEGITKIKIL
jgi:glutamate-1-semialdehyde 2,1-aminomutase